MKKAYTMIELLIVIVILGLLAATVLPKFIDIQSSTRESACKGALGCIRAAVAITYASNATNNVTLNQGIPTAICCEMFQNNEIPKEPLTDSNAVVYVSSAEEIADGAGWAYNSVSGKVWVNNSQYVNF